MYVSLCFNLGRFYLFFSPVRTQMWHRHGFSTERSRASWNEINVGLSIRFPHGDWTLPTAFQPAVYDVNNRSRQKILLPTVSVTCWRTYVCVIHNGIWKKWNGMWIRLAVLSLNWCSTRSVDSITYTPFSSFLSGCLSLWPLLVPKNTRLA